MTTAYIIFTTLIEALTKKYLYDPRLLINVFTIFYQTFHDKQSIFVES